MNCPPCRAFEELEVILSDIRQMEGAIGELKERLKSIPKKMASELSDENQKLEAARYLYWLKPEVAAADIANGLLGIPVNALKERVGKISSGLLCRRCSQPLDFRSRTQMKDLQNHTKRFLYRDESLCNACWIEVQKESQIEAERESKKERARLEELQKMPYHLYLKTPEWEQTRKRHLRSADYRCQVCNARGIIDVHHRTYERRGRELYSDLIALCRTCHEIFHREGKLAEPSS